eukprot:10784166-Alexandrium_andersonii.AAC.1
MYLVQLGRLHVQIYSPTARAPSARCTCRAPLSRRQPRGPSQMTPAAMMAKPSLLEAFMRWG